MLTASRLVSLAVLCTCVLSLAATRVDAQTVTPEAQAPAPALDAPEPAPAQTAPAQAAPAPATTAPPSQLQRPTYPQQAPAYGYGYAYGYPQHAVPEPQPQRYEIETRSRKSLWMPGIILLGLGWFANFTLATPVANAVSSDRDGADEEDAWAWSVVPIVGPIAQLTIGAPHPAIALTMGLFQIGGLALFIAGLVSKEEVEVPVRGIRVGSATVDAGFRPLQGGGVLEVAITHM
jgi:hypothetical protein